MYRLQQWNLRSDAAISSDVPVIDGLVPLALTPDGRLLLGVKADQKTAEVWNLDTGKLMAGPLAYPDQIVAARFSTDSQRVMITCADRHHRFWSFAKGTPLACPWKVHRTTTGAAGFSPTGTTAFDWSADAELRAWDVNRGKAFSWSLRQVIAQPVFTPDGRTLLVLHSEMGKTLIRQLDVQTGASLAIVPLDLSDQSLWQTSESVMAVSPNGKHAAYGGPDGTVAIWSLEKSADFQPVMRQLHTEAVTWLAFSLDGRKLATVSLDHSARVWDIETEEAMTFSLKHRGPVLHCTFSPDGRFLATVSSNEQAQDSRSELRSRLLRGSGIETKPSVELLERDRDAFLNSRDKTVRLWNIQGDLLPDPVARDLDVLLTGRESPRTFASIWQVARTSWRMEQDFPRLLRPDPSQEIAWHLQAVLDCEATQNNSGKLIQFDRLIALDPGSGGGMLGVPWYLSAR